MGSLPKLAQFNNCLGCMLCSDVCKHGAISMSEDKNGFWMSVIDSNKCVGCLACERKCEQVRLTPPINRCKIPLKGWAKDDGIRAQSASGGAFSAIALNLIREKEAVIYGATLDNNSVYHTFIQNEEDISKLQGSKYIQSKTEGIYQYKHHD